MLSQVNYVNKGYTSVLFVNWFPKTLVATFTNMV